MDEISTSLTYCRRYARAKGGQRAGQGSAAPRAKHAAGGRADSGRPARVLTGTGAVNGDVFAAYPDQVLSPTLVLGDVVVFDNLVAHKVAGLGEIVAARGAPLLQLLPYSPDFNPIELAFNKLKTWLRTAQARTREALENTIRQATDWISQQDAQNWFDQCGYHAQ